MFNQLFVIIILVLIIFVDTAVPVHSLAVYGYFHLLLRVRICRINVGTSSERKGRSKPRRYRSDIFYSWRHLHDMCANGRFGEYFYIYFKDIWMVVHILLYFSIYLAVIIRYVIGYSFPLFCPSVEMSHWPQHFFLLGQFHLCQLPRTFH